MRSVAHVFARFDAAEFRVCQLLNRRAQRPLVRGLFRVASRLGDGMFWYALMVLLPVTCGARGRRTSFAMLLTGLLGLVVYRVLKRVCVRERPFIRHEGIALFAAPLDRYSFPSGHTLHAVCFTWQAVSAIPALGFVLVPLAGAIAVSRVVLGLHYPTDVVVGASIGASLGALGAAVI